MSTAMFKRTGGADFPDKLKILVSGPPKSGKTSLLGTVPNIVVADTEPHANNLQSIAHLNIPYVTVRGTDDLQQLRFVLADESLRQQAAESLGMDKIEAFGLDTLDTLQMIMKKERMRETRQSQFLRDDWGWIKEEMLKIIQAFNSLPLHVIYTVHTKTKELGKGDDARTVVLPGLEGSVDQQIAGEVGYSLLAFRKQEFRQDGSPYTKYWLRAEGDENYDFLGNRTAGRLPDVIEPHFKAIYDAAMAGRPKQQRQEQVQIQTTGQNQPTQESKPQPQPEPEPQAQNQGQSEPEQQPEPQSQQSKPQSQPAQPAPENAADKDKPALAPDSEPVNAAALSHVKKVYDAVGLDFPEDLLKTKTLGEARTIVRMWQACQRDAAEGKAPEGSTPQGEMVGYLKDMELVEPEQPKGSKKVQPKVDGTIEEVMAYVVVDDQPSVERAQEAHDLESKRSRPRRSLLAALERIGAQPPTPVQTSTPAEPDKPAEPAEPAVTPASEPADSEPTEAEAVGSVEDKLGGEIIGDEAREDAPCEECGKPIDDVDIAKLSKGRFGRVLCVSDYIAETKKPRTA